MSDGSLMARDQRRGPCSSPDVDWIQACQHLLRKFVGIGQVPEVGDAGEVFATGEDLVDGGELPCETDGFAQSHGVVFDVVAGDACCAAVGLKQGGQDADGCCLARTVRAEDGVDGASRDSQVDAIKDVWSP